MDDKVSIRRIKQVTHVSFHPGILISVLFTVILPPQGSDWIIIKRMLSDTD